MSSIYSNDLIIYRDTLTGNPSVKGSVLGNDGNGNYVFASPSADGQILTSNSASPAGMSWEDNVTFIAYGLYNREPMTIPAMSGNIYFLASSGSVPQPVALISSTALTISVTPSAGVTGRYASSPTNITGGTLDFTLGFVPANVQNTVGNWSAYPGGPHFQINGNSINTVATSDTSFLANINIDVTTNQQVCWRMTNNLTQSADPGYNSTIGTYTQFTTR